MEPYPTLAMYFRSVLWLAILIYLPGVARADWMQDLQAKAIATDSCEAAHWGPDPERYSSCTSHTNRLIPVYTYGTANAGKGVDLTSYTGENSVYRDPARLRRLYKNDAEDTVSETAEYMDQTNVFDLQAAALAAGKKHIFLVVFDGMDWQTTQAAAIWNQKQVTYTEGRGTGTHFQEYQADGTSQYGWMVTSPLRDGAAFDVNTQRVSNPGQGLAGGYCCRLAGPYPWSTPTNAKYMTASSTGSLMRHAYTDSAASGTSMHCGVKTYNGAIGITHDGRPAMSMAHCAQALGYRVGAVTSVPISHATPAASYAHNVNRDDYQDLTRDLLGLPSVSHPERPLAGLDVVIGGGHGVEVLEDESQGANFVPGNRYLTQADLKRLDADSGGRYVVAQRTSGQLGGSRLLAAARRAAQEDKRLLGFYGLSREGKCALGHMPYQSANGDFTPALGEDGVEIRYSEADIVENPTLADSTTAALTVLSSGEHSFWLMVEAGDVDWANHKNNLDASIGAVNSGDRAVRVITDWVEKHSNWDESLMILTADHGHYLVLDKPELLIPPSEN